ncbi:MAG: GNAT family N-acetyltransferase [Cyanobacteria bacterium J06636_16]
MSQDLASVSFPCLETKRLRLRPATEEDAEAIFTIFSDPKVTQFHDLDVFSRLEEAIWVIERRAKGFESGRGIRWGIVLKQSNHLIGSCGFSWDRDTNAAEIGYELASQFWRQGIMSEALQAILHYGFETKEMQFVVAEIMLENLASRKLLKKLGFESQGVLEARGFWKEAHHDLEQFMLTRQKFAAL